MQHLRIISILILLGLHGLTSCRKEAQETPLPEEPSPTDTVTITDPVIIDPDTVYLEAATMATDTGKFMRIITGNNGNYSTLYEGLSIIADTLQLGNMRLLPVSNKVAHILPFKVWGTATTPLGYTYQVEGTAVGVMSISSGNLYLTIQKNINGNYSSDIWTYYSMRNTETPLQRSHYLGDWRLNASNATDARLNIETDTFHPEGVRLKQRNRSGYINEQGILVLPETPVDSLTSGNQVMYAATTAKRQGNVLIISQQIVYNGQAPQPQDYRQFIYVK
jgi:hypothetical protein